MTPTAAVTQTQSTSSTPRIQSQDCDTPPLTPLHQVFNIPPSPDMIRMSLPPASPEPSLALTATPSASTTGAGTGIQVPSKRKELANNLEDGAVGRADDVRPLSAPKAKKRRVEKSGGKKAATIPPAPVGLSPSAPESTIALHSAAAAAHPRSRPRVSAPTTALVPTAAPLSSPPGTVSAPAARRSRTSKNNISVISTPALLPAANPATNSTAKPDWFTVSLSMMGEKGLGVTWSKLVEAWAAFEENASYREVKKLPAANRPEAVKAWIQRARSPSWRPSVPDIKSYEAEYMLWWATLQPAWRRSNTRNIIFSKVDGDWESLQRPGLNGLLSVMAGLLFWGVTL